MCQKGPIPGKVQVCGFISGAGDEPNHTEFFVVEDWRNPLLRDPHAGFVLFTGSKTREVFLWAILHAILNHIKRR
jgi:hypothetical protein